MGVASEAQAQKLAHILSSPVTTATAATHNHMPLPIPTFPPTYSELSYSPCPQQRVVAFIVGISDYTVLGEAPDCKRNADNMRKIFKDKGVKVFSLDKLTHSFALNDLWQKYVQALRPGDIAFIFFSGLGCVFQNYTCLLARALDDDERKTLNNSQYQLIFESSLRVEVMKADLAQRGVNKQLFFLDCCREFRTENLSR